MKFFKLLLAVLLAASLFSLSGCDDSSSDSAPTHALVGTWVVTDASGTPATDWARDADFDNDGTIETDVYGTVYFEITVNTKREYIRATNGGVNGGSNTNDNDIIGNLYRDTNVETATVTATQLITGEGTATYTINGTMAQLVFPGETVYLKRVDASTITSYDASVTFE